MVTVTKELQATLQSAIGDARERRHEYVTLEHLLHAMTRDKVASEVLLACGADRDLLRKELADYLDRSIEPRPASGDPEQTPAYQRVLQRAAWHATGNLDLGTSERVFDVMRSCQAKRKLTSVIVTHNPDLASRCDRVFEMKRGKSE